MNIFAHKQVLIPSEGWTSHGVTKVGSFMPENPMDSEYLVDSILFSP